MKKLTPVLVLVVVVLIAGAALLIRTKSGSSTPVETPMVEETAPDLPFDQRPFVSLTPRSDGHWLKLTMQGINKVPNAATADYLLSYDVPDHPSQGSSGTIALTGISTVDHDVLIGSESSGKFRYDEGVSHGQLTIKFRDSKKKLLGALTTDFHMQSKTDMLTSFDNKFTYKLSKASTKDYYVVLNTFGVTEGMKGTVSEGPYGVFTSATLKQPGTVTLDGGTIMRYGENKWSDLKNGSSPDLGVFLSIQ